MAGKVSLRVKCDGGQGVVRGLVQEDSLEKLISHSMETLGMEESISSSLKLLYGFPPQALDISDRDKSLSSAGIRSGDTIIFQVSSTASSSSSSSAVPVPASAESQNQGSAEDGQSKQKRLKTDELGSNIERKSLRLERKVVPADNSCLFTSINYCMSGTVVPSEHSAFMREIIANTVSNDPEQFSEAYLGRSNTDYCRWIQGKDAWGGAIEVQILAEYFQVQIAVVDTKSGSLTVFGEGGNYPTTMVLIYDGIHYDALFESKNGTEVAIHPSSDKSVLEKAKSTALEAKAAHNYTDTAGFSLKCLVCGTLLKGAAEAQKHAKNTSHTNFGEVK